MAVGSTVTIQCAEQREARTEDGFEQFKCFGNPKKGRYHGKDGRLVVEVDWTRRLVKKRCDDCRQMHYFVSQEES